MVLLGCGIRTRVSLSGTSGNRTLLISALQVRRPPHAAPCPLLGSEVGVRMTPRYDLEHPGILPVRRLWPHGPQAGLEPASPGLLEASKCPSSSGRDRHRTRDLMLAKHLLSQTELHALDDTSPLASHPD